MRITCGEFKSVWCWVSTRGQNTVKCSVLRELFSLLFLPEAIQVSTHYLKSVKTKVHKLLEQTQYDRLRVMEHLEITNMLLAALFKQTKRRNVGVSNKLEQADHFHSVHKPCSISLIVSPSTASVEQIISQRRCWVKLWVTCQVSVMGGSKWKVPQSWHWSPPESNKKISLISPGVCCNAVCRRVEGFVS